MPVSLDKNLWFTENFPNLSFILIQLSLIQHIMKAYSVEF